MAEHTRLRITAMIVVVGGGSFGTAIGCVLAKGGNNVTMLVRDPLDEHFINSEHRNKRYWPDHDLPTSISASTCWNCVRTARLVLLAVPARAIPETAHTASSHLNKQAIVINLAKGLHHDFLTLNKALLDALPGRTVGALKGPTFSRPLLAGSPSGMTLALNAPERCREVSRLFVETNIVIEQASDLCSVEFISAAKNIFAIALGLCDATDDNPNTRFMILQKILAEAHQLMGALKFDPNVVFTYAGFGDLLMTSLCDTSRNRTLGLLIGRGFSVADDSTNGPLLEGRRSLEIVLSRLGKQCKDYPILSGLQSVFQNRLSPHAFLATIAKGNL